MTGREQGYQQTSGRWGSGGGGGGGRGNGGHLDSSSGSGEEGRALIRDLVPHQPNTVWQCIYI